MRYGPDHKFWVVVDPKSSSSLDDILFLASLKDLELQFKGGLTADESPTLFTERDEAEAEAHGRLVALWATQAIAQSGTGAKLQNATRIELPDDDGAVVFETDLRGDLR